MQAERPHKMTDPRHIQTIKNLLENLKRNSRFNESVRVEFVAEWLELVLSEWEADADCLKFASGDCRYGEWCLECELWKRGKK